MQGLTDGISSRYLRGNRSTLLPALESMRKSANRSKALNGRLDELLVFEIQKDGETGYHRFTVRKLYKYVLDAIKNTRDSMPPLDLNPKPSPHNLTENLALGNAIINQDANGSKSESPEDSSDTMGVPGNQNLAAAAAANKSQPLSPPSPGNANILREKSQDMMGLNNVTYRELLGGFLHPRDMRKLVTPFSVSNEPELIVRRHVMLLNFDPLRAIILRDRLLVLVPDGADSILVQLEQMVLGESENDGMRSEQGNLLQTINDNEEDGDEEEEIFFESVSNIELGDLSHIKAGEPDFVIDLDEQQENEWAEMEGKTWIELPFELQSVDAILNSVCSILADDVLDLQLSANSMITELLNPGADVGDHAQEVLRTMKNSVKEMMSRVKGFCRAVDLILEDYEDMALMNLSRLLTRPDRFIQPVSQAVLDEESDEPELILEAHLQRGHTLSNALTLVQGQINSTEDFAVRKSDSIRNRLLYINMMISLLSLSVAGASLVGSLFGMNVSNPLEEVQTAFLVLTCSTVGGSIIFAFLVFSIIRKVGALPRIM